MIVQWLLASIKSGSTLLNWLIWYWKLDWNSNDSLWVLNWTDTSITYSAGNGKIVEWAGLNWTTSKIVIPDSASFKVTTEFTINAWMKSSDTVWQWVVFSYLNTDSGAWWPYGGYFLRYNANKLNTIVTRYNTPSGAVDLIATWTTNICDWNWKMVTVIYDGINVKTYINWTLETTTAYTQTITYVTPNNYPRIWVWINDRIAPSNFFNGAIDEVWVWNRWITGAELTALYNSTAGISYPF